MSELPFGAVREWIYRDALPLWRARGIDETYGGFLEELSPSADPTDCTFKRVRVQCRQTYVFSHASVLGWQDGEQLSSCGYRYLESKARVHGHWACVLARSGGVINAAPNLYDLAFVLFAMAWRYRVSGDSGPLMHAHAVLDFVEQNMSAPTGGHWPILPGGRELLQNPLMHLTEACLAAYEASHHERFLDKARTLIDVFRRRLFDGRTLGERFLYDWRRVPGPKGSTLDPGHHFEWAWILGQYQKLTGEDLSREARLLVEFADAYGVDKESSAVYDSVNADGRVIRSSSRLWTNTERIKGHLALFELTGHDPRPAVAESLALIFERYFAESLPGLWIDQFDDRGEPMVEAVPASIVYHLFLAFQELLRLEPQLQSLTLHPKEHATLGQRS